MENLYKNFIKIDIMSDLNLENIVGFKAVDKDGNEQNVTVDEMVDMVSTRMVMALSETSTFAAAAATGNDVYENELPTVTDAANVRVLQSSGDAAKMTMQSLASKLGGLMNGLKLFPFMPKGILSTDEEVNSATASGMYHVFGRNGISVVSNYSIMIVFNDGQGYVIQMTFRLGEDVVGFRRNYNGEWGDFRSFVLAS